MSDGTHIEWTDATWNPITGCSVVSAGCRHCYAMKLAGGRLARHPSRQWLTRPTHAGPVWTGEVRFNAEWINQPLAWRRPRRIFVCAHGDLFHEAVPDEWIDQVFTVMALSPQHTFQVLTKRPKRMLNWFTRASLVGVGESLSIAAAGRWPLPNVWLGVSVENQDAAGERIPMLLQAPAAVRWVSAEPLLGAVDLRAIKAIAPPDRPFFAAGSPLCDDPACKREGPHYPREYGCRWGVDPAKGSSPGIDWVVAGGESGSGARPAHPQWFQLLRDQCRDAGVAFLFKQWGEWKPICEFGEECNDLYHPAPASDPEASRRCKVDTAILHADGSLHHPGERNAFLQGTGAMQVFKVGKRAGGRSLDGVLHDAYPVVTA